MKVTALIPDPLIEQVKRYSKAKNITGGLVIALEEWVALKKIAELNNIIEAKPLQPLSSPGKVWSRWGELFFWLMRSVILARR